MLSRIQELVKEKTNGKKMAFGKVCGWSEQYTSNILSGKGHLGIQPVTAIVKAFPDIDARWLLTGEGKMYNEKVQFDAMVDNTIRLVKLSKYLPVMNNEEKVLYINGNTFSDLEVNKWETLLTARQEEVNKVFAEAYAVSCKV